MKNGFEERYRAGDIPWDHGMPDRNLVDMVSDWPIPACQALDIGCGTGDNSIWLAEQHFVVTGCDIAETAIAAARKKAVQRAVECSFVAMDFLKQELPDHNVGFAFDRGCMHTFRNGRQRRRFAGRVAAHLAPEGLWLSLAGNADEPKRDPGPPQLTAGELADAVEPWFKILSLRSGYFGSDQQDPPLAWICLMQKRNG